jgi:L-aspartate oxidase
VLSKDRLEESATSYAQGGIAAALSDDDEIELHEHDTIAAGDGLCDREAVHTLVAEAPAAIEQLIAWGAEFDRDGPRLLFAREGAHSRARVLHAHGDSTGREIARTLYRKAASLPGVRFASFASLIDLLPGGGALVFDERESRVFTIEAGAVLLATGGLGRVFLETTNPDVATGDGVALAWRAGAAIADIEFVQFHPTALHVEGAPRFLLSEALRGEGAVLRNAEGRRFMPRYHADGELAARDVVSRAIVSEIEWTHSREVFLDLTHLDGAHVSQRFPRIYETCKHYGIDMTRQPVPVHPAAHYAMGGVATDLDGRTSVPRLFAAGEVACTGVHGANRLASNSLLEGIVFGARAGASMREWAGRSGDAGPAPEVKFPAIGEADLRALSWRYCGILRSGDGLREALARLDGCDFESRSLPGRDAYEIRNMHTVAALIARCALAREESRGAHYRTDCAGRDERFAAHSITSLSSVGASFVPALPSPR